jgi:hypothetical protein
MVSSVDVFCTAVGVVFILGAYLGYRWIKYGKEFYIVRLSFLELAVYQHAKNEAATKWPPLDGKPMGKPLYKYGTFMGENFKVYANGIEGKFGQLKSRRVATGGLRMNDHVIVEVRLAFVTYDRLDGIYPTEYSFDTGYGNLVTKVGVQMETKDHMMMEIPFEKDLENAVPQFKVALGRYLNTLYKGHEPLGGLLRSTGGDHPIYFYSGDIYRPKVLRDARVLSQGQRAIPNSQLRQDIVLALDTARLDPKTFIEWVQYWEDWLRQSSSRRSQVDEAGWLERRYRLLAEVIMRLERGEKALGGQPGTASLYYHIAGELVADHCTSVVEGREVVDREICQMAKQLVDGAKRVDPAAIDVHDLGSRIQMLMQRR